MREKRWLIDWCLTSSEQFFSYIQDDREKKKKYEVCIQIHLKIIHKPSLLVSLTPDSIKLLAFLAT